MRAFISEAGFMRLFCLLSPSVTWSRRIYLFDFLKLISSLRNVNTVHSFDCIYLLVIHTFRLSKSSLLYWKILNGHLTIDLYHIGVGVWKNLSTSSYVPYTSSNNVALSIILLGDEILKIGDGCIIVATLIHSNCLKYMYYIKAGQDKSCSQL